MADVQKHIDDVAKFTKKVNEDLVASLAKTYRLVLSKSDTASVACTQASELKTVRKNFLQKKLGLEHSDEDLDAAVKEVCEKMKASRRKSRLTFYYLLAEKFNAEDKLL